MLFLVLFSYRIFLNVSTIDLLAINRRKNKSSDFGATNTLCGSPLNKNKNKHKNNNVFVGKFVCLILFLNVISCFVFVSYFF